ncbi:MAG: DNA-protecting protein DprA [Muribaculaceae bacterium]|nr:DNA-protecting protein DprA [Muribaculaceae bacterium]
MKQLYIDEILALQAFGMKDAEIRKLCLDDFDRMLAQNPDLEDMLDKTNGLLDRQEEQGVVSIPWHATAFPERLKKIGRDCPAVIHCKGNIGLLTRPNAIAVIGARAADKYGNEAAYSFGLKFAEEDNVIVSGLALGCDAAAHKGCLDAGGETIAIVGNGLDICHPKENVRLMEQILSSGGLMLSEQPFGVKANPRRLVARNRLQAALSNVVILAQCPAQSGSLHTMRFARMYGKESYAVGFRKWTVANAGNRMLIEEGLAEMLPFFENLDS